MTELETLTQPAVSENNSLNNLYVVKRNGRLVPFRKERIVKALESAFRDTKRIVKQEILSEQIQESVYAVVDLVIVEALQQSSQGILLSVEGIQDLVEMKLMQTGHHDIARDYIIYRDQHKALREDSPRNLKVQRGDGALVRFNPMKIAAALETSFRSALALEGRIPEEVVSAINLLTNKTVESAMEYAREGNLLTTLFIEEALERILMQEGHFKVAKIFIISRALTPRDLFESSPIIVEEERANTKISEELKTIKEDLKARLQHACKGYESLIAVDEILQEAIFQFYEGIKESEVDQSLILATRSRIEREPAYSKVAAALLLDLLYKETIGVAARDASFEEVHRKQFKSYLEKAISLQRLSPALLDFDLDALASAMHLKRDLQFGYLGLQTLYDRYFIHHLQVRLETPQYFWMRVAMGLALHEGAEKTKRAIEFYNLLSSFLYVSGTPTLFNSGTMHSQLSSCYLSTVMDDLHHIFKVIADDAQLSKWAGGIGNDWTNVRATGALIKGTNGTSQGVIPFLKVANDTAVAVNQCFAGSTSVYTDKGAKQIADIEVGDLVLGISGRYRKVLEKFAYNQKDPMVKLSVKHSLEPIFVTSGHPFYAIQKVPMGQAHARTKQQLECGKIEPKWVDAGQLEKGDFVAQVIPEEITHAGIDCEDARLYGILLGDGHLSKHGAQWGVSGNPSRDAHLEFVRHYLQSRQIHFWETGRGTTYLQIHFSSGKGALRDATTGRIVGRGEETLPFTHEDLYNAQGMKHISPKFSHLPKPHTLALVQGLLETDGNVSRGKEITFTNSSLSLIEGLRYQLLRLGIPTAGQFRTRLHNHHGKRSDGSVASFNGKSSSCDLRIPAVSELASLVGCKPLCKRNWLQVGKYLFTRVKKRECAPTQPFVFDLKVEDDASYMTTSGLAHNGGKRKGAMCAYLETWHLDIEDFLELRKNTGDERRRTHDMNTANWVPDLFMKRVQQSGAWTLFSPNDVPDLHDLYGAAFEKRYEEYERMADLGEIKLFKRVEATALWRKMLGMLFETGHPWITFKDPSNIRSPQSHVGVVHSSNLCTEILLNSSATETAVCNLGSINLALHCTEEGLDEKKLASTVRTAVRMLDNVIDINFYPTEEAKNANLHHRAVGLGLMGFQDALYIQGISYASHEAVQFADESMEMISYYAILASSELAKERGTYSTYKGSKWDLGLLPIDTLDLLEKERGEAIEVNKGCKMNWEPVRASIKKYGMRNCNTMAIAPTATISNITGVTQSIEPMYKHLFVKSNLSGEFTVPNLYLVEKLKSLGLWDAEMLDDLKYFDGSILEIERIPDSVKKLFLTAFEIEPEWLIECASRRQKWIDMGQSLNLYLAEPSGKKLHNMYILSWKMGLKTNYYLRSLGATQIEKSTTDINKRSIQPRWMKNKSASSNIVVERGATCTLGETCESCQ